MEKAHEPRRKQKDHLIDLFRLGMDNIKAFLTNKNKSLSAIIVPVMIAAIVVPIIAVLGITYVQTTSLLRGRIEEQQQQITSNLASTIENAAIGAEQSIERLSLDVAANNIANVTTTGYKGKTVAFQELVNNTVTEADVLLGEEAQPAGINRGVKSAASGNDIGQGTLQPSDGTFHLAIAGNGFFGIETTEGMRYTRDGSFQLDGANQLVNAYGESVAMTESIPSSEWPEGEVEVSRTGQLTIRTETETVTVAQVELFLPNQRATLQPVGRNQFVAVGQTVATFEDGMEDFGEIRQGMLELSSVDLADEMIQLMTAQRAYSLNLKAIQTTDDLQSIINQFNR